MIDLSRFIEAQQQDYARALAEIKKGHKQTHWMWYIFPQIRGLGRSSTAQYYAIKDINEAKAFISDDYLGRNLREICQALLTLETTDARKIFGSIDAIKLRSSMTLFINASDDNEVFLEVLDKYFDGNQDTQTQKRLLK